MNEFFIFTLKSDNKKDKDYLKNRGKVYEEILSKLENIIIKDV